MLMGPDTFLSHSKSMIMGGGRDPAGNRRHSGGFLVDVPIPLSAVELGTNVAFAADETNARVLHVTETNDTVFYLTQPIPRDYDEETDWLKVHVLASQLSVTVDNDVELDSQTYIKVAGAALGADVSPAPPGTVLSTTEQWITFDLGQNGLTREDVLNFVLLTNGANDTTAEEVLIHAVYVEYASCLVSYSAEDAQNVDLR